MMSHEFIDSFREKLSKTDHSKREVTGASCSLVMVMMGISSTGGRTLPADKDLLVFWQTDA
jgi:hypothetical protein